MWRDFEGGIYWDVLAEICGDISRAMGFRGAATFQGNTVDVILQLLLCNFHALIRSSSLCLSRFWQAHVHLKFIPSLQRQIPLSVVFRDMIKSCLTMQE